MKIPKEARKLSRSLFRLSFTGGRLDRARISTVLREVVARKPRNTVSVLKAYERLVRLELDRRHAVIASATPLDPEAAAKILTDLQSRFGADITHEFKVVADLIGGLRVQIGSNVWDGSISGRLELLRSRL